MTDTETPTPSDRSEAVSRVLAALRPETTGGAIERDALRDALASEGRSLLDLPEVGLWLALTEVSLTAPDDLAAMPTSAPEHVEIDLRDIAAAATVVSLVDVAADQPPSDPVHDALSVADELVAFLARALDEPVHLRPDAVGTTTPEPYWPRRFHRWTTALGSQLTAGLGAAPRLALHDPSEQGSATLDPYWPRPLARQLADLAAFLDSLFELPTTARVPASRLAGATNGAIPDPYWPRHLVRPGARERSTSAVIGPHAATPRTPDELERDLQDELAGVSLVGEANLDAAAAELEISLARLVRAVPLDRLGRVYPATLASFLVRQTMLHPDPATFDAEIPVTALRRSNAVGLAFSEALVRLAKPVFREIEQRDEFDRRFRYLRRMELHAGLPADVVPAVVKEVRTSFHAGAMSGREVTADWLFARNAVTAAIGAPAFRLLACTDHGAAMMAALVDLVRADARPTGRRRLPADLTPLPPAVVDSAWHALWREPLDDDAPWGELTRPRVRLGRTLGDGPQLELPRSAARWHLNGELLTYGSPSHRKWADVPPTRTGRWSVAMGTGRKSPNDIRFHSVAADRIVLVFDEHRRLHHPDLRLGGATATVIAPAGSNVSGAIDRTLLVGRWVGFEQIEVDLIGLGALQVDARGREAVVIETDPDLGARLQLHPIPLALTEQHEPVVRSAPTVAFGGHVPAPESVEVVVTDHRGRHRSLLSDLWITSEQGAFGLDSMFESDLARRVTVSVQREGFAPVTRSVAHLPARARLDVRPALADVVGDLGDPEADRWTSDTGWAAADTPDRSLTALVGPLALALQHEVVVPPPTLLPPHQIAFAPLSLDGWLLALSAETAELGVWATRHRRPIWQWRTAAGTFANLDALWAEIHRTDATRAVLPLVAAALLAFIDGPRRGAALDRLADAAATAPRLTTSAATFAAAYASVRSAHPESRFRPIVFPPFSPR